MKLYLESDEGYKLELKQIETIDKDSNVLILMGNHRLSKEDAIKLEDELSNKINKKCVYIQPYISSILGIR